MSLSISYLSLLMLLMMIGLSVVQADTVDCNLSLTQADGDPRACKHLTYVYTLPSSTSLALLIAHRLLSVCKTWSGARFGQNSKEYTCPADQCSQVIGNCCFTTLVDRFVYHEKPEIHHTTPPFFFFFGNNQELAAISRDKSKPASTMQPARKPTPLTPGAVHPVMGVCRMHETQASWRPAWVSVDLLT